MPAGQPSSTATESWTVLPNRDELWLRTYGATLRRARSRAHRKVRSKKYVKGRKRKEAMLQLLEKRYSFGVAERLKEHVATLERFLDRADGTLRTAAFVFLAISERVKEVRGSLQCCPGSRGLSTKFWIACSRKEGRNTARSLEEGRKEYRIVLKVSAVSMVKFDIRNRFCQESIRFQALFDLFAHPCTVLVSTF